MPAAKDATKTTEITLPLTTLVVGLLGPFTTRTLPSTLSGYTFDFQNDITWPTNGQDVCTFTVEQSNDNGATWAFDASLTLSGNPWHDRQGNVVHTSVWNVSIDNQGSTTRKVRISANTLQVCVLGAVISSLS